MVLSGTAAVRILGRAGRFAVCLRSSREPLTGTSSSASLLRCVDIGKIETPPGVGETGAAGYAHVVKNHVSDNLWGTTFQGIKFRGHGACRKILVVIFGSQF
jgi:hypothetical protein